MQANRLTYGYLLLVGVPLLVLVSASELGKGITAPPAVAGEWTLQTTDPLSCVDAPNVTITQSGEEVVVSLHDAKKTRWQGLLQNARLNASGSCGGKTARFEAAVEGERSKRILRGQLWVDGCDTCARASFTATRSPSPKEGGR
ncbi:MAG: hypothetical protein ABI693_11050 [Bryobacteraceae bacterium]